MQDFRIVYYTIRTGEIDCITLATNKHEFKAENGAVAWDTYQDFKTEKEKINRDERSLEKYFVGELFRIDQREITTKIC